MYSEDKPIEFAQIENYLNQYLLWDLDLDRDFRGDLDLDLDRRRDDLSFDLDLLRRRLSRESDLERWLRRRDLERDLLKIKIRNVLVQLLLIWMPASIDWLCGHTWNGCGIFCHVFYRETLILNAICLDNTFKVSQLNHIPVNE